MPKALKHSMRGPFSWTEYKTVRQYRAMGYMLDEFRLYGFRGGIENMLRNAGGSAAENGHGWLTE